MSDTPNMNINRRGFLQTAAAASVAVGVFSETAARASRSANDKLVVGLMGTGIRGQQLANTLAKMPNVQIAYTCDVDTSRAAKAAARVAELGGNSPKSVEDFRNILDDQSVDALVVATCNHWHAPAGIMACSAGKHVYVEKPLSHNPREGELLVEASRKYDRRVQMGNQRRSYGTYIDAVAKLREGVIGRPYIARSCYQNLRPSIGRGEVTDPPAGLNYDLWQGPAPRRPFHSNYLHYNWHWFWHWGNGEVGNNGIHMLDICRWGLGVDLPLRVTSIGGRYNYEDDQETPDTQIVCFDFDDRKSITFESFSCNRHPVLSPDGTLCEFRGDQGTMIIGSDCTIFDRNGKQIEKIAARGGDENHLNNFIQAIQQGEQLNADCTEGHKSTLLCHLGNMAHRVQKSLDCDPKTGKVLNSPEAMELWSREYAPGWEPKV